YLNSKDVRNLSIEGKKMLGKGCVYKMKDNLQVIKIEKVNKHIHSIKLVLRDFVKRTEVGESVSVRMAQRL
ncbi:hypothetical protein P4V61_29780, partial [Bacillus thuringiensis]|nr:hypothetical protein [Bacillus thuringiensis]